MSIYRQELLLRSKDVDMFRRLRTSELFRLLQEASIRHTEQLGMGREKTLDKGLLWILLQQRAEIARMPEYDEQIVLKSWPGRTMHLLFPRYYSVETAAGEPLVKASALWGLVDADTRKMIFPEKHGVVIEGVVTGEEIALPATPAKIPCDRQRRFTVPYSYVDLNGHMNNTRYFDLAEDSIPAAAQGRALSSVLIDYANEARCGQELLVSFGCEGDDWYLTGEAEHCVFRMRLGYAPQE